MKAVGHTLVTSSTKRLLNDVIGPWQERLRNGEPEGLRSLEVDDQVELDGPLDRFSELEYALAASSNDWIDS